MKKNILVSVDRGETRVAVLEAKGSPQGGQAPEEGNARAMNGRSPSCTSSGGAAVRSSATSTRARSTTSCPDGGGVRRHRPGAERLPARRRDRPAGRPGRPAAGRGRGPPHRRADQARQEIIVQVVKDPLKTKGARLSMQLSIAGRYLVYMPQGGGIGVSKRLPDRSGPAPQADRKVDIGKGGVIVRTAAQGAKKEDFVREIAYLHRLNEVVEERAEKSKCGRWSSRRPTSRSASSAMFWSRSSRARSSTTTSSTTGSRSSCSDRAGVCRSGGALQGQEAPARAGRTSTAFDSSSAAASTCPPAAT